MIYQLPLRLCCALDAPFALAGCLAAGLVPDPQSVSLAASLRAEAQNFYSALATEAEPQCRFEQNMNEYNRLDASAAALRQRVAASGGSAARMRAADALARAIAEARASHALASARSGDQHGPCMAPGAIALNADAIARASAAFAADTPAAGDQ